jgi:hypothetical protein
LADDVLDSPGDAVVDSLQPTNPTIATTNAPQAMNRIEFNGRLLPSDRGRRLWLTDLAFAVISNLLRIKGTIGNPFALGPTVAQR